MSTLRFGPLLPSLENTWSAIAEWRSLGTVHDIDAKLDWPGIQELPAIRTGGDGAVLVE